MPPSAVSPRRDPGGGRSGSLGSGGGGAICGALGGANTCRSTASSATTPAIAPSIRAVGAAPSRDMRTMSSMMSPCGLRPSPCERYHDDDGVACTADGSRIDSYRPRSYARWSRSNGYRRPAPSMLSFTAWRRDSVILCGGRRGTAIPSRPAWRYMRFGTPFRCSSSTAANRRTLCQHAPRVVELDAGSTSVASVTTFARPHTPYRFDSSCGGWAPMAPCSIRSPGLSAPTDERNAPTTEPR